MRKRNGGHAASDDVGRQWYIYNPDSPREVIDSRLRRQRHYEEILHQKTQEYGPNPQIKKGPLGLNEMELAVIREEAEIRFFDHAKLSEQLRERRRRFGETLTDRLARFNRDPDHEISDVAEQLAVLVADACEKAVGRATGDFADMLTQAVIARRGRKDFSLSLRREMWAESLRFALGLARFETADVWIDKAWGTDPRESPLPHLHRLESISERRADQAKFVVRFRATFEERIRHGSSGWLNEADRRIELRTLLSSTPQLRANLHDSSKRAVRLLLTVSPELTTEQVCHKLDVQYERNPGSAPVPEAWRKRGARSWFEAYCKFKSPVETYISNIRKEFRH